MTGQSTNAAPRMQPESGRGRSMLLWGVLFAVLLAAVEYWVGWARILAAWRALSPIQILLAAGLVVISYLMRTLRIHLHFLSATGGRFALSLRMVLLHNLFNNLLPMRAGELSLPLLMKRYFGVRRAETVGALLWFRFLDLLTLSLIGVAALLLWLDTAFAPALLIAPLMALLAPWLVPRLITWSARRLPERWSERLQALRNGFPQARRQALINILFTLLNWSIKLGAFAWILFSLAETSAGAAWLGAIAGDLSSVLPMQGFAAAGTFEAGVMAVLVPTGTGAEQALSAAINLHLFLLGLSLLSGALALLLGREHVT
ncbi:putative membrane protein [endosymbiont of Riftia pachyptila (vent Ph05)]|uniref:Putative membrane protein n=2 Tax=endosymbiont of Riftia pachyptila TaxID=54396 RepID=G2D9Q0_9GAMM|nr:putative membrane protein [endosymbiont of Riftia pachyptila (vent Ph05)]